MVTRSIWMCLWTIHRPTQLRVSSCIALEELLGRISIVQLIRAFAINLILTVPCVLPPATTKAHTHTHTHTHFFLTSICAAKRKLAKKLRDRVQVQVFCFWWWTRSSHCGTVGSSRRSEYLFCCNGSQVIRVLENFEWPHGTKMIHVRIRNAGLIGGWLESWFVLGASV